MKGGQIDPPQKKLPSKSSALLGLSFADFVNFHPYAYARTQVSAALMGGNNAILIF